MLESTIDVLVLDLWYSLTLNFSLDNHVLIRDTYRLFYIDLLVHLCPVVFVYKIGYINVQFVCVCMLCVCMHACAYIYGYVHVHI